jgi:heme peroxidase
MADTAPERLIRVLTNLHHGGRAVSRPELPAAAARTAEAAPLDAVIQEVAPASLEEISTPFGYLFGDLVDEYPSAHLLVEPSSAVVAGLKALGSAMVDAPPDGDPNSTIPPVYTYWGQFVDHDVTANTDRNDVVSIVGDPLTPIEPALVPGTLRNLREPALNLDSVYGNGPDAPDVDDEVPYDGITFRLGPLTPVTFPNQVAVPGDDLPRVAATGRARVGDSRNDENLIVAQLHLAFLKFHNAVVHWLVTNEPQLCDDDARFARARDLTRWHYQAIVVEDFLRTVAMSSVVDELLATPVPDKVTNADGEVFMPLEHSVAAYRFGHSMVRAQYDHNENFGRLQDGTERTPVRRAEFAELFQFTGNGIIKGAGGLPTLPDNWPIRWTRFTDKGSPFPDRFARKIDTHLSPPLKDLSNEGRLPDGSDEPDVRVRRILKRLAVRNLLRGYRLGIPTGQAVAGALGVTPLTADELTGGDQGVVDALVDGGFVEATPLWFYVLREAEVHGQGQHLGEVGSRIVCTTLIGQIQADPGSYLNRPGGAWTTAEGVKLAGGGEVDSIRTFLEFAGVQI